MSRVSGYCLFLYQCYKLSIHVQSYTLLTQKYVPMPTHLGGLQDRVKQKSSRFPNPQQASLDENEPRRASNLTL
jgi:hypothetical protein